MKIVFLREIADLGRYFFLHVFNEVTCLLNELEINLDNQSWATNIFPDAAPGVATWKKLTMPNPAYAY